MRKKKTGRTIEEKAARMPEIREAKWSQVVPDYLQSVRSLESESAKSQRFLLLLNQLFGIQPGFIEDYVAGIEKYVKVKQKDRILRGRVDELFGNLVIEFERDLTKKKPEAEEQLRKYVACLWSQERKSQRAPYVCVATDGIDFGIYSPAILDPTETDIRPEEVSLGLVERVDLSHLEPDEVYFWLDRYLLREETFSPKTESIVKDFGVRSHAFQVASQSLLSVWKDLKARSEFSVVYDSWEKYLLIVYGGSVADEELFIRHTFLGTLAKLMVWTRLTEAKTSPDRDQILSVLEGRYFKDQGIENFLEEDFFSWVARTGAEETGVDTARILFSLLRNYNLRELSEDVLKSLYQELVDPKTRHDLGEYYTPDWLAHRIVQELLERKPDASVLDPACGSGTFLYLAVREKRQRLKDSLKTLRHILDSVAGVDIHPLAVIVAKTNYILALGDLLKKRRGRISIPLYLSDTIRPPERETKPTLWMHVPSFRVELNEREIYLPESLLQEPALYDEAIEAAKAFAVQNLGDKTSKERFAKYLQAHHPALAEDDSLVRAVFHISETLRDFIESRRDTIWAFVLKNIYKPLFLKDKFDFVVGNPPWLSFRYAEPQYQKFLKGQITETYGLLSGRGELITHLELGTLFFLRTADLYLREGGTIAFVLPRSVFSADQHDSLRQGKFRGVDIRFEQAWDLEKVNPLFNVPACVLFGRKESGAKPSYPISGLILSGELEGRNAALRQAEESLAIEQAGFFLNQVVKRSYWSTAEEIQAGKASYYKHHFRSGACIYPRPFWFVELKASPLGFDPSLPPIETAERAKEQAKDAYKGCILRGNVGSRFLYATVLSADLLPFGHLDYRLVLLPIEPSGSAHRLVTAEEAHERGFFDLAKWLERVQSEWEHRRGRKAKDIDAIQWLDYRRKLTSQNPRAKYRLQYNTSGTYLCACLVENRPIEFHISGQRLLTAGFLTDIKTFYFETDDRDEGLYLCGVLNAAVVDRLIKPMQSRGLWGPRDIHKKVLELPIPRFDSSSMKHLRLAELGEICSEKVAEWLESGGPGKIRSIGKLRAMVREMLGGELKEIDRHVEHLLKAGV